MAAAAIITHRNPCVLACITHLPPPLQHMERVPRRVGAAHQQQVTCVHMPLLATPPQLIMPLHSPSHVPSEWRAVKKVDLDFTKYCNSFTACSIYFGYFVSSVAVAQVLHADTGDRRVCEHVVRETKCQGRLQLLCHASYTGTRRWFNLAGGGAGWGAQDVDGGGGGGGVGARGWRCRG